MTTSTPLLLKLSDIRERYVPVSRRTMFRMMAAGKFPRADIKVTERLQFWKRDTIERWMREQTEASKHSGF